MKLSTDKRLSISIIAVMILLFSLQTQILYQKGYSIIEERESEYGESITALIVHDIEKSLETMDTAEVREDLERSLKIFNIRSYSLETEVIDIRDSDTAEVASDLRFTKDIVCSLPAGLSAIGLPEKIGSLTFCMSGSRMSDLRKTVPIWIGISTALLLIFGVLSIILLTKKILGRSMKALLGGVNRFISGDLSFRFNIPEGTDIGTLAHTYNRLAEQIQKVHANLENTIESRTRELEESEIQFRLISTSLPVGMMLTEADESPIFINRQFENIFELDKCLDVSKKVEEAIHPDDKESVFKALAEAKAADIDFEGECRLITASGKTKWIDFKTSGFDIDGDKRYILIVQDISKRKQSEENLKRTQMQLIQAEKLAGIGQLAAGIAHEINNPVGFVASNSETIVKYIKKIKDLIALYERSADADEINEYKKSRKIPFVMDDISTLIDENIDGLKRITGIVKNLKDFARIDTCYELSETDLNACISNTLVIAKNELKYNVEVELDLGNILPVLGNGGELNQVILNLLINSVQAIKSQKRSEKGHIKIRTYQEDKSVFCEIEDDGPGIPENILSRIFEPFFTTKEVGTGTGLGLSITYDIIVNKHKGNISVDTEENMGCKFTIELPQFQNDIIKEIDT